MRPIMIAVKMTIVLTVLTGILYPLVMVGLAHVAFPAQAEGSLIYRSGTATGSSLIGRTSNHRDIFTAVPRPQAATVTMQPVRAAPILARPTRVLSIP